ncbi:MAG: hypothetical protein CSB34_05525 [Desulfobulbus propionicus]|nr:MAG: hypothetical protein CSB34_05525 [Desulfobulbus propionicus]
MIGYKKACSGKEQAFFIPSARGNLWLGFKMKKQDLGAKPVPVGPDKECCFSRVPTLLQYFF